ncbi:MAG: protein ligase [Pseudomonadota bacterium]
MTAAKIDTLDAARALAREGDLLDRVSTHPEETYLWFWQSPRALVAPRKLAAKPQFETAVAEMAARGWPVYLRGSGGDVTPQGAGIVNVTHVYARPQGEAFDLEQAYERICGPLQAVLGDRSSRGWMPGAFCDGAHNIQIDGRKFAGTAMRFRPARANRTRYAVMAHAIMLFEPPQPSAIEALNRFLIALDEDRRIALEAHTGLPKDLTPKDFIRRLSSAFR